MHYSYGQLDWQPLGDGWERAVATLAEGDSAWNPASTKHVLYGPSVVTYDRAPDGGIVATERIRS